MIAVDGKISYYPEIGDSSNIDGNLRTLNFSYLCPAAAESPAGVLVQESGGRAEGTGSEPEVLEAMPPDVPVTESHWTRDADGVGSDPNAPDAELGPETQVRALSPARSALPTDVEDPGNGIPTNEDVLEALTSIAWPRTTSRPNVSSDAIEAMCLGMSWNWSQQSADISAATTSRPNLTKLLTKFAARIPDAEFTMDVHPTQPKLQRDGPYRQQ